MAVIETDRSDYPPDPDPGKLKGASTSIKSTRISNDVPVSSGDILARVFQLFPDSCVRHEARVVAVNDSTIECEV